MVVINKFDTEVLYYSRIFANELSNQIIADCISSNGKCLDYRIGIKVYRLIIFFIILKSKLCRKLYKGNRVATIFHLFGFVHNTYVGVYREWDSRKIVFFTCLGVYYRVYGLNKCIDRLSNIFGIELKFAGFSVFKKTSVCRVFGKELISIYKVTHPEFKFTEKTELLNKDIKKANIVLMVKNLTKEIHVFC